MICESKGTDFIKWDDLDDGACVVDYCLNIMDVARKESCGTCVLCREGTRQIYEIIKDITEGNAKSDDYDLMMDILEEIKYNASCEMSREAASICIDMMKKYEEEWYKHISRKRCTNMVCKCSYTLYVDPQICDGCGKCMESCSYEAIAGSTGMIHVIDIQRCNKCMVCVNDCPKGAIKKAGTVKPRIPKEPVLVGSFDGSLDDQVGSKRRRRRRKI